MSESIRQQIVDKVVERFTGILAAAGYKTDLGKNVHLWRDTSEAAAPFGDNELPAANIWDTDNKTEPTTFATRKHTHRLTIEVELRPITTEVDKNLRRMIADIAKAIGVDRTWGGLARDTEPFEDKSGLQHAAKVIAGCSYKFVIVYETIAFDPYNK